MIAEHSGFLCDGLPTSTPLHLPQQWLGVHNEGNTTTLLNINVCVPLEENPPQTEIVDT